ncbi:hypothetical protein CBR_g6382 [Chara braunii]|uniref:mannosyl-glycoprotein endo-beta-N-acetylglucosaminidase n=1 Tax=Chara braunii TaxID=69332 RepID=A0A388KJW1_CHABU|nr:hypothetical protein CBR_g6382 [Chara braunii]|eukprot:GBG70253.1 hypothetical protein CBR_g6382 [Chara braunii]
MTMESQQNESDGCLSAGRAIDADKSPPQDLGVTLPVVNLGNEASNVALLPGDTVLKAEEELGENSASAAIAAIEREIEEVEEHGERSEQKGQEEREDVKEGKEAQSLTMSTGSGEVVMNLTSVDFLPLASALKTLEAFRDWSPSTTDRSSIFNVASTPLRVDWRKYHRCSEDVSIDAIKVEEADDRTSLSSAGSALAHLGPPPPPPPPPTSAPTPIGDGVDAACHEYVADGTRSPADLRSRQKQRLLVCHDMMGGYVQDSLLQGGSEMTVYRIWHWELIDIFVYFSHHLVTIPPATWTNAAHTNGVQMLGTFITEWAEGAEHCRKIFATVESARHYASQLVQIAAHFGFDGWLINIENRIEKDHIANLLEFLRCLTEKMHVAVPMSQIIWYDSVTEDGVLDWQNELTEKNKCFLEVTDGLFTNYCWKERSPAACALAAGTRASDVYMGVDVFGRNTYGGGGYHCDLAVKAAKNVKVSAALFAPGWVYETKQPWDFEESQDRFWKLIANAWVPPHPCSTTLPFLSTFDQGVGLAVYREGRRVSSSSWHNLSSQSIEPCFASVSQSAVVPSGTKHLQPIAARISFDTAFSSGASLKLAGKLAKGHKALLEVFRPFIDLQCIEHNPLQVSYVLSRKAGAEAELVLELIGADECSAGRQEENPSNAKASAFIICSHLGAQGEPANKTESGGILEGVTVSESSHFHQAAAGVFDHCDVDIKRPNSCMHFVAQKGPSAGQQVDHGPHNSGPDAVDALSGDVTDVDAEVQSPSVGAGNGERMEVEWELRAYEIDASVLKGRTIVSIAVLCSQKKGEMETLQAHEAQKEGNEHPVIDAPGPQPTGQVTQVISGSKAGEHGDFRILTDQSPAEKSIASLQDEVLLNSNTQDTPGEPKEQECECIGREAEGLGGNTGVHDDTISDGKCTSMRDKPSVEEHTPHRHEEDVEFCAFLGQVCLAWERVQRVAVNLVDCKDVIWGSWKHEKVANEGAVEGLRCQVLGSKGDREFSGTLVFEPSTTPEHVLWYDVYYWGLTSSRLHDGGVIEQLGKDWREGLRNPQRLNQGSNGDFETIIDSRPQWLGTARLQAFRVYKLHVPGSWDAVGFGIEAVDRTGVRHPFRGDSQALVISRADGKL